MIQQDRELCQRFQQTSRNRDYYQGALDSYSWILSQDDTPVTGRTIPVTLAAIKVEERAARAVLYREPDAVDVPRSYASGVEHALMWASDSTDDSPGGQRDPDEDDDDYADEFDALEPHHFQ